MKEEQNFPFSNARHIVIDGQRVEIDNEPTGKEIMKEEQEVPKELGSDKIEMHCRSYGHAYSFVRTGAIWAKEGSDAYWKYQLLLKDKEITLLKEESDKRLIEEAIKAFNQGDRYGRKDSSYDWHIKDESIKSKEEYLDSIKARYGI